MFSKKPPRRQQTDTNTPAGSADNETRPVQPVEPGCNAEVGSVDASDPELQHTRTLLAQAHNDLALANCELSKVKHDLTEANTRATHDQLEAVKMTAICEERRTLLAQYQGQARAALDESNILKHKLLLAEKDIAALYDQVKLNNGISPGEVVSSFRNILATVVDISDEIAGAIGVGGVMAQDVLNRDISLDHLPVALVSLWRSKAVRSRGLDELLENSIQIIINSRLNETVFNKFHPQLSSERSKFIEAIYGALRKEEPQMISGTFRVNMFNGIDLLLGGASRRMELASQFVQHIREDWNKVLVCLPRPNNNNDAISMPLIKKLEVIYCEAYDWNHSVKSRCISLDYHPHIAANNSSFNNKTMDCRLKAEQRPQSIICTKVFGLSSSEAIGKEPTYVCQLKTVVLSEIYFQTNYM